MPSEEIGTRPSAPVSSSFTKRPKRATPGDRALELGADPVGEAGGEVAVGGVALGHHRAALGHRDVLAGVGELPLLLAASARPSPQRWARIRARWTTRSA